MVAGLRSSFCLFPLPHPGPAMTASNSRAGTAPADCLDHPRISCGSHSPWHWQPGSGAEPGASPFILAKLQQTRQVSVRFVFVTPTRPCLALPNVAAAIHTIPAEHWQVCAPWKRTQHQRASQEVLLSHLQHQILSLSLSPSHVTCSAVEFSCRAVTDSGCALLPHDSGLAFSQVRQKKCFSQRWDSQHYLRKECVLNKTMQESAVLSLALLPTLPFHFRCLLRFSLKLAHACSPSRWGTALTTCSSELNLILKPW